jgi:hypothetical protein
MREPWKRRTDNDKWVNDVHFPFMFGRSVDAIASDSDGKVKVLSLEIPKGRSPDSAVMQMLWNLDDGFGPATGTVLVKTKFENKECSQRPVCWSTTSSLCESF